MPIVTWSVMPPTRPAKVDGASSSTGSHERWKGGDHRMGRLPRRPRAGQSANGVARVGGARGGWWRAEEEDDENGTHTVCAQYGTRSQP
eukprot:3204754-Prymnesium_polylepis.1